MLRKLLYLGVATFVVMTISAVAFGEAVAPQARSGNNLLKRLSSQSTPRSVELKLIL